MPSEVPPLNCARELEEGPIKVKYQFNAGLV